MINEFKINVLFKDYVITCDFEKSLIRAIRDEFIGIKIHGRYFHFIKALWKKIRNLAFTKKLFKKEHIYCI